MAYFTICYPQVLPQKPVIAGIRCEHPSEMSIHELLVRAQPALALDLGAITLLKACGIPALYLDYTYNRSSLRAWISTRLIRYAFVPVTGFESTLMLYKTWSSISASIGRSANTSPVE